ncbi:hypothetical protein HG536_0H03420 [Torulaspora globosa]|uniref:SWR1-complex protein 5 n=1 Tax=Torulaspora globosa TaxID=48254 RepID=A0A7G3ZN81_9SACH|nr:uncharacterized protein HG536_0H03420 [Torulaspora globosa]QLL34967.1 hypothetical protein HG536_0H03420 [Torulaspora globosa]
MAVQADSSQKGQDVLDEEQYNEEEDEDFSPGLSKQSEQEDEDEEEAYQLEQEESGSVKKGTDGYDYSHIESESGGLIRTRRGRLLEEQLNAKRKYEGLQAGTISESVNDIWEELQQITHKRLKDRAFCGSVLADGGDMGRGSQQEEQILIKRDYKFAGEVFHEEKMVPISSSEAQEYLKSKSAEKDAEERLKAEANEQSRGLPDNEKDRRRLRRPLKRPPYLEQIIAGSLKPKLTTLEKSSLDWAAYVNKEGLTDELTLYNKDGYLAKQDFLNRVEMAKDDKYRELRQKQLAAQLQEQQ